MKTSDVKSSLIYDQDEIQEILQIAIARKSIPENDHNEMTQEQLWEIAEELGIDINTITEVEKDWQEQKLLQEKRNQFDFYRRQEFQNKIIRFSIINFFLMALNLLGAHQLSWSLYIALIWGMFLTINAWQTFTNKGEAYKTAFSRWERKSIIKNYFASFWDKLKQL